MRSQSPPPPLSSWGIIPSEVNTLAKRVVSHASPTGMILSPKEVAILKNSGKLNIGSQWIPNRQQFKVFQRMEFEILFAGSRYGGKAQPLSSKVLTPYGWTEMGALKIGSFVTSPGGGVSKVIGIYPQGKKVVWRFLFSDGSSALATSDHLWLARKSGCGIKSGPWKVFTSKMMRDVLENGPENRGIHIPLCEPVQFHLLPNKNSPDMLTVQPYLLGILLGDGGLTQGSVKLTCKDDDLVRLIKDDLRGRQKLTKHQSKRDVDWGITDGGELIRCLKMIGCWGKRAEEKSVPERYKSSGVEVRRALLQGLMDTDGYVDVRGHVYFTTVSPLLASDVQYLCRSLGFKASVSKGTAGYKKDGSYIKCQDAYDVTISGRNPSDIFRLKRKIDRCQDFSRTHRRLVSIEEAGEEESQCIAVDNPSGLYITDDFVVTHNTACGIRWIVQGNPDLPNFDEEGKPILVNCSYVYHPNFLGAVIRKNEKDLSEWVDNARQVYATLGGEFTKYPSEFRFPSGARIFTGHAEDKSAWEKYQGLNITRYLIEEAGQIPSLRVYELLRASCRCPYPGMRAQILLNANPIGSFLSTLFDRFIEPKDPKSGDLLINLKTDHPYQPEETIEEKITHPFSGEEMTLTRVWVPSYFTDNPFAMRDSTYALSLASITDEKTKRAFLYGDWRAFKGTFFDCFSRERHILPPSSLPIQPWMKSYGSLDIGYTHEAAALWARRNPDTQQVCIYKEFGGAKIEAMELGVEIARRSLEELKSQDQLTFFISHDAYHKRTGDLTYADLLQEGARKILGKSSVYVPDMVLSRFKERMSSEGRLWDKEQEERLLMVKGKGLIFRVAPRSRVIGFSYMRGMMRLLPLVDKKAAPDLEVAMRIAQEDGPEAFYRYIRLFQNPEEILPKLLISSECKRLIDAIPKAVHSEEQPDDVSQDHFLGMDFIDSARYLLTGMRDTPDSLEPYDIQRMRIIQEAYKRDPHLTSQDLFWIDHSLAPAPPSGGFSLSRRGRGLRG